MGSIFPCSCLKINIGRKEKFASLFNDRLTVLLRELLNRVCDLGLLEMLTVHELQERVGFLRDYRAGGFSWRSSVVLHDSSCVAEHQELLGSSRKCNCQSIAFE
jgi:hypothetical protein